MDVAPCLRAALFLGCGSLGSALAVVLGGGGASPGGAQLPTRWSPGARREAVWQEHPRPTMVRPSWQNLNGLWQYSISTGGGDDWRQAHDHDGRVRQRGDILVPFSIESNLSGVGSRLSADDSLWYKRRVRVSLQAAQRHLLHFEAVDYECVVLVNGRLAGSHKGGNTPFGFDVTDLLVDGMNELIVGVRDTMDPYQLMGKQSEQGGQIWYSASTGIRGTVWLEAVPDTFITNLTIATSHSPASIEVRLNVEGRRSASADVRVKVLDSGESVAATSCHSSAPCTAMVPAAKLWSPASPHLYDLEVELVSGGVVLDSVKSYAGIRTVGTRRDAKGVLRFTLNDEFIFHYGVLDQGWWPDGGLTPPSDAAMRFDVDFVKSAGFNVIRKHMKVEPRRFYAYCDQVGVMVWQDQPAAAGCEAKHTPCGRSARLVSRGNWIPSMERVANFSAQEEAQWPEAAHGQYLEELTEMMNALQSNPSVVVWVPFNEGWGQHRTAEVSGYVKSRDPSRLVNAASGGNFFPAGDIADRHSYPLPNFPMADHRFNDFVRVIGEFGGHTLALKSHAWQGPGRTFGYSRNSDKGELAHSYNKTLRMLMKYVKQGVSGAIYTQTTDVENELNGLLTYDREVAKLDAAELRRAHAAAGLLSVLAPVAGF